jgi:hypothetical protein
MSEEFPKYDIPVEFNQKPVATIMINPTLNEKGIIVARREHPMYSMGKIVAEQDHGFPPLPPLFGKYQYFYESEKGVIDMITQPAGIYGLNYPEIFEICSNGRFFEGPERYHSREDAEKRIMELLASEEKEKPEE